MVTKTRKAKTAKKVKTSKKVRPTKAQKRKRVESEVEALLRNTRKQRRWVGDLVAAIRDVVRAGRLTLPRKTVVQLARLTRWSKGN